ncbi:glycosyltransferase family 2 protein [Geodermatophilus nigrescens]
MTEQASSTRRVTGHRVATAQPSAADDVDCAVVVVTYRSAMDLGRLLSSLPRAAGTTRVQVTVVDNASADDVGAVVASHPRTTLVRSRVNLGYAGAINLALRTIPPSRWVLILNPDLVLETGAVETLIAVAERTGAGAVVPKLLGDGGRLALSQRREPTVLRALGEAVMGDHLPARPSWAAEMVRDPLAYEFEHEVDWATGAAVLLRRAALEAVGGWDARFFLYSEETDYFRRLRERGFSVVYTPAAVACHRGGGSGNSAALVALLAVNRVRYFRVRHGSWATAAFWAACVLHAALRSRRPVERAALRGLLMRSQRWNLPDLTRRLGGGG